MYAASALSLAALEYLAHIDPDDVPDDLVSVAIHLPAAAVIASLEASGLPSDWRSTMAPASCQRIGDEWIRSARTLGLIVPSVLIPDESNVLLNPHHPDMATVQVARVNAFAFNPRLLR